MTEIKVVCFHCQRWGKINLNSIDYQGFEEVKPGIWLCDRCSGGDRSK